VALPVVPYQLDEEKVIEEWRELKGAPSLSLMPALIVTVNNSN